MRYSRSYWGASAGQKIAVMLGNEEVARTDEISSVNTQTFVQDFDWPSAGDFTLMVTNVLGTSPSIATVVDDLRLEYVDSIVFDSTRPDGLDPAALGDGESLSTTLNVSSNGFYYLALSTAGLAVEETSAAGVYNSYQYYPAKAKVAVDGVDAASFVVESPDITRLPVPLPYLTAGSHTIAVTGLGDAVATQGKVCVEKAELLPLALADGPWDVHGAAFTLADGASLALDYPGTNRFARLRVDGKSRLGVLDASTSPAFLSGPGAMELVPMGFVLVVR